MTSAVLILALLFGADAKLKSPDSAEVGVPVLVDADDSVSTADLQWSTSDADLVIFPAINGGRQAYIVRLKPGIGRFTVTAKDAAGSSTAREAIPFTGDAPDPQPAPRPDVPDVKPDEPIRPDAKLPDGKFKVAQQAKDKAKEVKAERRKEEARMLADKIAAVRDKVKSGEIDATKPLQMAGAYRAALAELPPDVQRRWHGWGVWWGGFLRALYIAGELVKAVDWVLILEETILGLRAVV